MEAEDLIRALVSVWWVTSTKGEVNPAIDSSLTTGLLRATRNALEAYRIVTEKTKKAHTPGGGQ